MEENKHGTHTTYTTSYRRILEQFEDSIKSLRTFVHYVQPSLKIKENEFYEENAIILSAIHDLADSKINPLKYSDRLEDLKHLEDFMQKKFNFSLTSSQDENSMKLNMSNCILTDFVVEKFNKTKVIMKQADILFQSSLISLIVFFELLITNILRRRIYDYPESFGIQEKSLSLDNIRKLGSLKDAEEFIIEKEIERVMRSSFDDWCQYFKDKLKRKFEFLDSFRGELIEIFQRRNLIVHNGGIVNNIYISNVDANNRSGIEVGEKLEIDLKYIDNAINIIEKAGELIALDIWQNAEKLSSERLDIVDSIAYEHMKEERWDLAASLYNFLYYEKDISNKDKLTNKMNYWQCYKWMGKYDEINNEILQQDFSDKSMDFQLCMLAIKGDFKQFFELLPEICPSIVSQHSLITWPIFREIRMQEDYKIFIKKISKQKRLLRKAGIPQQKHFLKKPISTNENEVLEEVVITNEMN